MEFPYELFTDDGSVNNPGYYDLDEDDFEDEDEEDDLDSLIDEDDEEYDED